MLISSDPYDIKKMIIKLITVYILLSNTKMLTLCYDVIQRISTFLTDKEKITLTSISKSMDTLKYKFIYHELIDVAKIEHLIYFDNFECVDLSLIKNICPKFARYVRLTSNRFFDQSMKEYLPSSVIHMVFGFNFNQSIKNCVPSSVTYLTFGDFFNRSIKNNIP